VRTEGFRGALLATLVIASFITPLSLLFPRPIYAALTPHDPIYIENGVVINPENEITAFINIAPSANFTYSPVNPRINETVTFNAENSYDPDGSIELYEWDWENNRTCDDTGEISIHSFSTEGDHPVNLRVTDNGGATNNITKIVRVVGLESPHKDGIKSQYDGFFLTGISIYNTYTFSDPENPPDKVDFIMITEKGENVQPEDNWVTDDNEWKAKFNMGELEPNPTLRVVVYRGSSEEPLDESVTILETQEWLKTLVNDDASDVSFENKIIGGNRYWVMEVETGSINTIGSRFDAPIDYIGGLYSLNTPSVRTHLEISSDTEAGIVIPFLDLRMEDAVSVKIPYGKAEAKYWLELVGEVEVRKNDITWKYGRFYVGGDVGAEFEVSVPVIPFIVEAGIRGAFWANASFDFSLFPSEDGGDEWLLLPGIAANGVGEMGVGARACIYAEVLCGVAGVEGGLEGKGKMKIQLPEGNSALSLEYGLYAKAWILFWSRRWARIEYWSSEMEPALMEVTSDNYLPSSFRYENVENFEVSLETLENTGMELLVEKPYPFSSPSVAINQKGEGIIVWTDENREKDPRRAFEIFYSYYEPDEVGWTEAQPVTSDEFTDFDSVVTSLEDGRMMMVWNRTPEALSLDAEIKQALGRSELAYSIWDPLTHTWSEPRLITNNECLESGKALTRIGDDVVLTYVLDTDNDPFTLEGNSIRCMTWNGSTWSEPEKLAENLSIISIPRLAMLDENNGGLVYLADADDNLLTSDDRRICLIEYANGGWEEMKTIREGGKINDPWVAAIDNQIHLTWIEETVQEDNSELDTVYIGEIDLGRVEISPSKVVKENVIIGRQQLLTDGKRLLLVYQTGENNTPYLLKHEEGKWKQEGGLAYNGRYEQLSVDASNGRLVTAAVRPMTKIIDLETKLARSDLYVSMLKEFGKPEGVFEGLIVVETTEELPEIIHITENLELVVGVATSEKLISFELENSKISEMGISLNEDYENVRITLEKLKEKPPDLPEPPGQVWAYYQIDVNVPEFGIENATINFWVLREWLSAQGVNEESVALLRYHAGEWEPLPSEKMGEDSTYVYYSAESSGFSVFAIVGKEEMPPSEVSWVLISGLVVIIAIIGIVVLSKRRRKIKKIFMTIVS